MKKSKAVDNFYSNLPSSNSDDDDELNEVDAGNILSVGEERKVNKNSFSQQETQRKIHAKSKYQTEIMHFNIEDTEKETAKSSAGLAIAIHDKHGVHVLDDKKEPFSLNLEKGKTVDSNEELTISSVTSIGSDNMNVSDSTSETNIHFKNFPDPKLKAKKRKNSIEIENNEFKMNESTGIKNISIPKPKQTDSVMVNTSETDMKRLWTDRGSSGSDGDDEDLASTKDSIDTIFSDISSSESEESEVTFSEDYDSSDLDSLLNREFRKMNEVDIDSSWGLYDMDESSFLELEKKCSFDHIVSPADYKKLHFERRTLIGPYKFKIAENQSKEKSLYRAIAKAVFDKESEWNHVERIANKQLQLKWDYYNDIVLRKSKANAELNKESSQQSDFEGLFKSYTANSKRMLPSVFKELHAAASYFGFRFTLFETFEDDKKVYPHQCDDKNHAEPCSDVCYYFLQSGDKPNDWQYELLIPIGAVGLIPHRDYPVKFRNSILVHSEMFPHIRYPLENECMVEAKEEVKSRFQIFPWSMSCLRKISPLVHPTTDSTEKTEKLVVVNESDEKKRQVYVPDDVEDLEKYREPHQRVNIHEVSYHKRMKMDVAVYFRNFMIYKTSSHDLFTLLSEVMFCELKNASLVRDQVKEEIRKASYMHIVSKTRRKETLVEGTPDLNHKNFKVLYSKKPDDGNVTDLDNAAQYFEFSYIVIGCNSNLNFFWKECRIPKETDKTPFLAFFVYNYYKTGNVPARRWYFLSEEQATSQTYRYYFGGSTMHKLREWNNHLYITPKLTKHVQSPFPDESLWKRLFDKLCFFKIESTPVILHYVVPVSSPKSAYRLELEPKDAQVIDDFITENGAKNDQTHRLSRDGGIYILKVRDNKPSAWITLWSLKNKPKYGDHLATFNSWALRKTSGLWHSINRSPLLDNSSTKALQVLSARIKMFIRDALNATEFEEEDIDVFDTDNNQLLPESDGEYESGRIDNRDRDIP